MERHLTHRKLTPGKLIIASHNSGKVKEINELVRHFGIEALSAGEMGLAVPVEDEKTFMGNAKIKALAAARACGVAALADDSGLEVAALDGRPGVHTADWAETPDGRDFYLAMDRVRAELEASGSPDRTARFVCCLCLAWPDGHVETFLGTVEGSLSFPPRGAMGFGFDPVFVPDGYSETFAELDPETKQGISHRADAFAKLVRACLE
ncbi:MAG: non-canonical purine NTP pyrophosphatase [Parvularculaceae bacterium]|nr:non-canonical purine NTP pyrophosphatase [Parvularculaceae bacterium]